VLKNALRQCFGVGLVEGLSRRVVPPAGTSGNQCFCDIFLGTKIQVFPGSNLPAAGLPG
jgi:hypothetical protein